MSWSPLGRALTYDWDFDSDGTFDQSSDQAVVSHTWTEPYDGDVTLRVTDSQGQSALTRVRVTVAGDPIAAPARPGRPRVALRGRTVIAKWKPGRGGGPVATWVVRATNGAVLGYVKRTRSRTQTAKLKLRSAPTRKAPLRVTISAANAGGESPVSAASKRVSRRR
jgi:PKD repeat protein